jgi:hypothetical protein
MSTDEDVPNKTLKQIVNDIYTIKQKWWLSFYDSTRTKLPQWNSLYDRIFNWKALREQTEFCGGVRATNEMWEKVWEDSK